MPCKQMWFSANGLATNMRQTNFCMISCICKQDKVLVHSRADIYYFGESWSNTKLATLQQTVHISVWWSLQSRASASFARIILRLMKRLSLVPSWAQIANICMAKQRLMTRALIDWWWKRNQCSLHKIASNFTHQKYSVFSEFAN